MHHWFEHTLTQWKQKGWLAIAAALFTELLIVLWGIFVLLFSLETLLPTFITIRLSLTWYLVWLLLSTMAALWLHQEVEDKHRKVTHFGSILLWGAAIGSILLLALSMSRFSFWPGVFFLIGYFGLGCLMWRTLYK